MQLKLEVEVWKTTCIWLNYSTQPKEDTKKVGYGKFPETEGKQLEPERMQMSM